MKTLPIIALIVISAAALRAQPADQVAAPERLLALRGLRGHGEGEREDGDDDGHEGQPDEPVRALKHERPPS